MIGEVRRQFKEYNLLGSDPNKKIGKPDYKACVDISTQASLWEMLIPGTLAICAPLIIGFFLGAAALGGMLVGGITSGFMLAVYMANAGGAWDNAKKFIEAGGLGEKREKVIQPQSSCCRRHRWRSFQRYLWTCFKYSHQIDDHDFSRFWKRCVQRQRKVRIRSLVDWFNHYHCFLRWGTWFDLANATLELWKNTRNGQED